MKRFLSFCSLLLISSLLFSGCKEEPAPAKTFTVDELSITLTEDFSESPRLAFTAAYESHDHTAVLIIRESADIIEQAAGKKDVSLNEYAVMVLNANQLTVSTVEEEGILTYTYSRKNADDGVDYTYFVTLHQSEEAFWLVQFVTQTNRFKKEKNSLLGYAASITFDESAR